MLYRRSVSSAPASFVPWSVGASTLILRGPDDSHEVPLLGVRCRLGGAHTTLALLDTGAEWSVIGGDTAAILKSSVEDLGLPMQISTRRGHFAGTMCHLDVELLAEPARGDSLCIHATALLLPEWDGPAILGYRGLLERTRFAIDPVREPALYFGLPED